jgi:uncharacterized protein (TIRG00374 family)
MMKTTIKALIGLAFLVAVLTSVNVDEALTTLSQAAPSLVILGFLVFLTVQIIAAFNIYLFLQSTSPTPFTKVFSATMYSLAAGLITPGRVGEASIAYFLKDDVEEAHSLAVVFLDKALTVAVLAFYASFAVTFFIPSSYNIALLVGLVSILVAAVTCLHVIPRSFIHRATQWLHIRDHVDTFIDTVVHLSRRPVTAVNTVVTLVKWGVTGIMFYALFLSVGVDVSLVYHVIFAAVMTLSSLLPFTVSGLGVREAAGVALYHGGLGAPASATTSALLLALIIRYAFAAVVYAAYLSSSHR